MLVIIISALLIITIIVIVILITKYTGHEKFSQECDRVILFYLPSCGPCRNFLPTWNKFFPPPSIKKEKIDSSIFYDIANSYNVKSFPTVLLIKNGKQIVYKGDRSLESLRHFAK